MVSVCEVVSPEDRSVSDSVSWMYLETSLRLRSGWKDSNIFNSEQILSPDNFTKSTTILTTPHQIFSQQVLYKAQSLAKDGVL